jgi:hypothetical protein
MSAALRRHARLIVLVVLALAAWLARDRFVDGGVAAATTKGSAATRTARAAAAAPGADDVCAAPAAMPQRTAWQVASADPFAAPRAPVARAVPVPVAPAPVVLAPTAPATPRLPYRFLGHFDEPGQPPTVFLGLGDQLIHARAGDSLAGGFRLETIGRRELGFVHIQQGVPVRMPIDGEPS